MESGEWEPVKSPINAAPASADQAKAARPGKNIIVLNEYPIAYVRNPKVANSSIKLALARLAAGSDPDKKMRGTTKDLYWRKNKRAAMVGLHQFRKDYKGYFCFSFVRNPFDRLVACYNNKVVENTRVSTAMGTAGIRLGMPFADFVDIVCATPDPDSDVHLRSQAFIMVDSKDRVFPDFIGYLERIKADWERLNAILTERGAPSLGALPTQNVRRGGKSDLATYYTSQAMREKVFERYRDDFRHFYPDVKP
jgi:hypothetical protein